jgi:hypothetical protein
MSIDIQRAYDEGQEQKRVVRAKTLGRQGLDRCRRMELELREYPEKGHSTPLTRMRAGLNVSVLFADDRELLQSMLGLPDVISESAPKAA